MALLGISLIVASVVLFCLRRPAWLPAFLGWSQPPGLPPPPHPPLEGAQEDGDGPARTGGIALEKLHNSTTANGGTTSLAERPPVGRLATSAPPPVGCEETTANLLGSPSANSACEGERTPKASASILDDPVPLFAISGPELSPEPSAVSGNSPSPARPAFGLMPPPPRPVPDARARAAGSSTLPASLSPLPDRGPPGGLAPPPTHSSKPKKPSKQVALAPGHSPLDWARLSGYPGADLRGLPRDTPYLRVTSSLLRRFTGRKGKDAWTVLGGKVYNITPYLPFHPGGEPELLRVAGRDGTKLFGEIHPWVNFEGMLSACLVGIYVTDEESTSAGAGAGSLD